MQQFSLRFWMGVVSLLTLVLSIAGCSRPDESQSEANATVRTDSEGLAEYLTLPVAPLEVQWVRFRSNSNPLLSGENYRLVAALRYDADTLTAFRDETEVRSAIVVDEYQMRDWFPADLQAALTEAQGESIPSYFGESFAKAPYKPSFFFIMGDWLVVNATTETW